MSVEYVSPLADLGMLVFLITISFLIFVSFLSFIEKRKTKKYREEVADLYVAGKIRNIATEDNVKIDEEKLKFLEWYKKERKASRMVTSLDNMVEAELMEKVSEPVEKAKK